MRLPVVGTGKIAGRAATLAFRRAAELQKVLDLALVADLDRKEHRIQG